MARTLLAAAVLALLLGGCLLTRLFEFKQQFCDFDRYFSLQASDGLSLLIHEPILLDTDIVWLAGAEPTVSDTGAGVKRMRYVIDKVAPSGEAGAVFEEGSLAVDLEFGLQNGKYRLRRIGLGERFSYLASPGMLDRRIRNTCDARWLMRGRSGEIDLSDTDLSDQPTRQSVLDALGEPYATDDETHALTYVYRLRGDDERLREYAFTMWYDDSGDQLLRTRSRSARYTTTTDYVTKKMWIEAN